MTDTQNTLHVLLTEDSESDLGILLKKNLKFDEHINNTVNKVNRIIGLIKMKFTYMDKKEVSQKTKGRRCHEPPLLPLYETFWIRP